MRLPALLTAGDSPHTRAGKGKGARNMKRKPRAHVRTVFFSQNDEQRFIMPNSKVSADLTQSASGWIFQEYPKPENVAVNKATHLEIICGLTNKKTRGTYSFLFVWLDKYPENFMNRK